MDVKRVQELDGLRGLAAIAVVIYHYLYRYEQLYGHQFEVPEFLLIGKYGVHLFFIVSGFVIYWTISRCDNPLDFLWSRFSRLYPTYWFAVTLTFIAVCAFSLPNREVGIPTFILNFLMFHSYLGVKHVDGVYWTLTLELAFYFWIFIIFSIGQMKNIEKILIGWILFAIVLALFENNVQVGDKLKKFLILDYIGLFAAGICFYKYKSKTDSKLTHIVMALSVLLLNVGYSSSIAAGLSFLYCIFWLATINRAQFLANNVLVYLGYISYSLYLIHQNIGYIIINKFYELGIVPWIGILSAILLSLVLAHLTMVFVERPSLKILRNLYRSNNFLQLYKSKLVLRK